jgi:hypothetical protein
MYFEMHTTLQHYHTPHAANHKCYQPEALQLYKQDCIKPPYNIDGDGSPVMMATLSCSLPLPL